jgi:hypothetical protein
MSKASARALESIEGIVMKKSLFQSRLGAALLTLVGVAFIVGCNFFVYNMMGVPGGSSKQDEIKFNHKFHIELGVSKDVKTKSKDLPKDQAEAILLPAWDKSCTECHKSKDELKGGKSVKNFSYPGHAECVKCHSNEIQSDCLKCHSKRPEKGEQFVHEVTGELIFNHQKHVDNPDKQLTLYCTSCHTKITGSTSTRDLNIPSMWDCRDCHGGTHSQEDKGAKWSCDFCHTEYVEGVEPRTHSGARPEFPVSHDVTFRFTHGRIALKANNGCDRCHDSSACDRCHFTEIPSDHTPRFYKSEHGREATHKRERCAACHEAGFCVGCHSVEPSTHFQANFQAEGHGFLARRDLRSCFACHQFADTCVDCHNQQSTLEQGQ